jgi:hypothetical protein
MAVGATAVWRARPSGSNTNGGGYDPGISGAATDYSQQNSAQASGSHGTSTGTTTFVDAIANLFTAAMVGNALYITGTGLTTGWYFCVGYTSASSITLDRSPGTGTVGTWHLGGGWADFWTNTTSSGPLVPGNIVYILGSGVPNPASYTYDYTVSSSFTPTSGDTTNGLIKFIGDPNTPSSGWPCIKCSSSPTFNSINRGALLNLWFVAATTGYAVAASNQFYSSGIIFDQFGYDMGYLNSGLDSVIIRISEFSSSVAQRTTNNNDMIAIPNNYACWQLFGCNIHDVLGKGFSSGYEGGSFSVSFCIFAKNGDTAIKLSDGQGDKSGSIFNCVIDGNLGDGIDFDNQNNIQEIAFFNNIISNHTTAGKYGMLVGSGSTAQNDRIKAFIDYNTYYNNTNDVNNISYGPHDTHGGINPFVGQPSENYSLVSGYYAAGTTPSAPFPQNIPGWN